MSINIEPNINFKYKKKIIKKINDININFENLKDQNIYLITLEEFLKKIVSKFSLLDKKYLILSRILENNIDFNKFVHYSFSFYTSLWKSRHDKINDFTYLFLWSNSHDQILDKFINNLNKNKEFKNILNILTSDHNQQLNNIIKLFNLTILYLSLIDPKLYIFLPLFIVTKSTTKILDTNFFTETITSTEMLNSELIYDKILIKFTYLNKYLNNQDFFISLQEKYFKNIYERIYLKYTENEKIEDFVISLYVCDKKDYIEVIVANLIKSFTHFDNHIIKNIYTLESIPEINYDNDDLPWEYSLGDYYFITFKFKINNFLFNLLYGYNFKFFLTITTINKTNETIFKEKILNICKFLNINKRNCHYKTWGEYYEINLINFQRKQLTLNQLIQEFLKPYIFIQKLFLKNLRKKINYKIKKI